MNKPLIEIYPGCRIVLHLSLTLEDGTEALSTFEEEPLQLTVGDGTLREGMELALTGLKAGGEQTLLLDPEQTYGWHNPDLIVSMPPEDFPDNIQPTVGQVIGFTAPNGEEMAGMVLKIENTLVKMDFNHPLAGKELSYKVKILSVDHPE